MARFSTLKSALGWHAARRKGPQLAQQQIGPRVQDGPKGDDDLFLELTGIVCSVCVDRGLKPDLVMRWASTSDGAISDRRLGQVLGELRERLVEAGLLDRKVRPVDCEDHTWTDYEGNVYRTKRCT